MKFRASFCDPFSPDIIEIGDIAEDQILPTFEQVPWLDFLRQMEGRRDDEIQYSPSLEIENKETRRGLSISIVGDVNEHEFYIFYKRPQQLSSFFGLRSKIDDNYLTDIQGQTKQDALDCLQALLADNHEYLHQKIK